MERRLSLRALILLLGFIATGCAAGAFEPAVRADSQSHRCTALFTETDAKIAAAGVSDAASARIEGFPYLRVNRFLASFRTRALDEPAFTAWAERLRALDRTARRVELANLPGASGGDRLATRLEACGETLLSADLLEPKRRSALEAAARVPDHYSDVNRVLGLYPLAAIPVGLAYRNWRKGHLDLFAKPGQKKARVTRLAPEASAPLPPEKVAAILRISAENPLNIPDPGPEAMRQLFASFAPVFEIETESASDRIGAPQWRTDGTNEIDTAEALAYGQVSHGWFEGEALLQLSYVVWFPARAKSGWLDPLAGHLDGVVWRVTLKNNGRPLVYDTVHACGCYHLFFPVAPLKAKGGDVLTDFEEEPLVPMEAPRIAPGERLSLRLLAKSHYLTGIRASASENGEGAPYALHAYDTLRSLPLPDGGRRSLFGPDGLIEGTERFERFFLWPMGISSAGAMRQWGTHATAFIGRRHFDDPYLLDEVLRK